MAGPAGGVFAASSPLPAPEAERRQGAGRLDHLRRLPGVLTTPRPPTIIARDVSRRVALQVAVWIVTLFCVALMFAAPLRQLIWYFGQGTDGINP